MPMLRGLLNSFWKSSWSDLKKLHRSRGGAAVDILQGQAGGVSKEGPWREQTREVGAIRWMSSRRKRKKCWGGWTGVIEPVLPVGCHGTILREFRSIQIFSKPKKLFPCRTRMIA